MMATVLVMAGGTGGHVFPALAVAEEMRRRGFAVEWLGTRAGIEAEKVPAAGFPLHTISITGIRGKRLAVLLKAPVLMLLALAQALRVVRRLRPAVVLGMGGFASGPGGVAAWLLRRPLVIHEQNAVPGTTNRLLARLATQVLEGFAGAFGGRRATVFTGNPVRPEICALQRTPRPVGEPLHLLVVGGSLGALAINELLPPAIELLQRERRPQVRHQAGRGKAAPVVEAYKTAGVQANVVEFIEDMAEAWRWADLAVCRAGALTVAEVAAAGVPALLVPLPHAIDDHQTANARWLERAGGGVVLPQRELTAPALAERIADLDRDRDRLARLAEGARSAARPGATAAVADVLQEVGRG